MKNQIFSLALAVVLTLGATTGCRKDKPVDGPDPSGRIAVNLTADILSPSKLKVANDHWEPADQVGLFMKKAGETPPAAFYEDATNVQMSIDGIQLTSTPPVYYPLEGNVDFIAYYPYVPTASMGAGYTMDVKVAGQASGLPTEVLYSNNVVNQAPTHSAVTLNFTYSLAKFVVTVYEIADNLTAGDFAGMTVAIEGMNTQAKLNLFDGTLANQQCKQTIGLHPTGSTATSAAFEALVLPTACEYTFKFTVGGKTYTCVVDHPVDAATQYNLTFLLNVLAPEPEPVATLLNTVIIPRDEIPNTYVVPVYAISAYELTASFGSVDASYTQPAAQTVTVTNTGSGAVTLTQPVADYYDIGALSATELAPKATATFTVQPKANLPEGVYDETIVITGSNGTSVSVEVSFEVNEPTLAFNGPHILSAAEPCELAAIDFDFGGQGVGFFSSNPNVSGTTAGHQYRINGGCNNSANVDIDNDLILFSGNHNLNAFYVGEDWFQYTVEVQNAGTYSASIFALPYFITSFRILVDDVDVTDLMSIGTKNANWSGSFEWFEVANLELTQGRHKIKINWVNAFVDYQTFKYTYQP